MRIGNNPQRHKKVDLGDYFHQVILPVYIPNLEGYYKESFDVFKLSVQSLIKTSHANTYISIISNGSCELVNDYIKNLYNQKEINEFAITGAIGKVNAILKGLAGMNLPLVTITDADVLFLNDWQKATYDVFENFPKAGVVCPVPNPSLSYSKTSNVFRSELFSKQLQYSKIKNIDAVLKFAVSIDEVDFFKREFLKNHLTISNNSIRAVLGAGHFVATYKSQIFNYNFRKSTEFLLGGQSENELLDEKAIEVDLWRLSTEDNYAYHLGNSIPDWVDRVYNNLSDEKQSFIKPSNLQVKNIGFCKKLYLNITNRIISNPKFRNLIIKRIIK